MIVTLAMRLYRLCLTQNLASKGCRIWQKLKVGSGSILFGLGCIALGFLLLNDHVKLEHSQLTRGDICITSHETKLSVGSVADVINIGQESAVNSIVRGFLACHRANLSSKGINLTSRVSSARRTPSHWSGEMMNRSELLKLIEEYANKYGLDPAIVYGVCMKESTLDMYSFRVEENYRWTVDPRLVKPPLCTTTSELAMQKMSHGIMQVMGATFREQGFRGWMPLVYSDVRIQLKHGCMYLAKQIKRFGGVNAGLAAYNAGRPVRMAGGAYQNQDYVDKVLEFSKEWSV